MWTRASALLLVLASCLLSTWAQRNERQNIWKDPITFKTKQNDSCTMRITGQMEQTKLRVSCVNGAHSYWCEYLGMPGTCRAYSRNPRHYFTQIMWGLRKLRNACQGPRQIKPQMCKNAIDASQMIFSSTSYAGPQTSSATGARAAAQLGRLKPPLPVKRGSFRNSSRLNSRTKTTQRTSPSTPPTQTPPAESDAQRTARQYCWRSLRGVCAYVIGLVRN
ncbi:fibroblast growth factor binding protein 2a [Antennarius striatus]|uniref:fibroblast growth factor binding protein 2a n=1 Tax=Antennarius striatus TaxID=241820 RepID=UPI0035B1BAFF